MTLRDGYHDVPPGKVASVVTYLEMTAPAAPRPVPEPKGIMLDRVERPGTDWYRDLFARVGGHDWLWFSRLNMAEEELRAILHDPDVEVYALMAGNLAVGLLELVDEVFWVRDWRRFGGSKAASPVHDKSLTAMYFPGALRSPQNRAATVDGKAAARAVRRGKPEDPQ